MIDLNKNENIKVDYPVLLKIRNNLPNDKNVWFSSVNGFFYSEDENKCKTFGYKSEKNWELSLREACSEVIAYIEKPKKESFKSLLKANLYIEEDVLLLFEDGFMLSGKFVKIDNEIFIKTIFEYIENFDKVIGFLPIVEI